MGQTKGISRNAEILETHFNPITMRSKGTVVGHPFQWRTTHH